MLDVTQKAKHTTVLMCTLAPLSPPKAGATAARQTLPSAADFSLKDNLGNLR
jgi:hypothetical protein